MPFTCFLSALVWTLVKKSKRIVSG
ncbi:rCG26644 [Rattus norvegicus]|uniref:RCG26644 n=1 Tax=Rattus norvegicus TaxID=10116 RepID=A6HLU1_RAT|nr:rCG26644 [Rattus norvegicus]